MSFVVDYAFEVLSGWLEANDVVPGHVPVWAAIDVDVAASTLTVQVYTLDDRGRMTTVGDEIATHRATIPLKVPPSEEVARLLAGRDFTSQRLKELREARADERVKARAELAAELAERLRKVRLAGEEFAPWPGSADEVTADGLARYFAVMAQKRLGLMWKSGNEPLFDALHTTAYTDEYGLISLLRAFADVDRERADETARSIWQAWDAGDVTGEHLWEWLVEYGVDPDQLVLPS